MDVAAFELAVLVVVGREVSWAAFARRDIVRGIGLTCGARSREVERGTSDPMPRPRQA